MKRRIIALLLGLLMVFSFSPANGEEKIPVTETTELSSESFPVSDETIRQDMQKYWGEIQWQNHEQWRYRKNETCTEQGIVGVTYEAACYLPVKEWPLQICYSIVYDENKEILSTEHDFFLVQTWEVPEAEERYYQQAREDIVAFILQADPSILPENIVISEYTLEMNPCTVKAYVTLQGEGSNSLGKQMIFTWEHVLQQVTKVRFY